MKRCYFKNRSFKIATMIQLSKVILKNCCVGYFVAVAAICFKKWLFFVTTVVSWLVWLTSFSIHLLRCPFLSLHLLWCWPVGNSKGRRNGKNAASSARRVVTCLLASWFNVKCLDLKADTFHSAGFFVFFGDSGIFWHNPGTQNYCVTSQANWICNLLLWWVTTAYYYNRHRYMIYKCTVYK